MTAPRTAAGRALLTNAHWDADDERLLLPGYVGVEDLKKDILAIEAEADRSLLLDAALRALVEALTRIDEADFGLVMDEGDPVGVAYHAARAALAATDVRGALAVAVDEAYEAWIQTAPADQLDAALFADAIIAALAAKGGK